MKVLWTWKLAKKLKLTVFPLLEPLEASALDGRLLYRVTHHTKPLKVIMTKVHTEQLSFHLFSSPLCQLILGLPCLCQYNPKIN